MFKSRQDPHANLKTAQYIPNDDEVNNLFQQMSLNSNTLHNSGIQHSTAITTETIPTKCVGKNTDDFFENSMNDYN